MIQRHIKPQLRQRLAENPAVALIGPRQCGKTTLARSLGGKYFDLEQESERLRLDLQWDRLITAKQLVVLDEAQFWPAVFARLRGAIDQDRKRMGRFLLLGSVSPALMVHVSESLAGRLSLLELTPFQWRELETKASRNRLWLCGGYPDGGVLKPGSFPRWQADYLTLLTQRDLPTWGLPSKPQTTQRLMRMLAAVHGQAWNASQVGQSLGLTYQTINTYLDFLEGAFLIRRLLPFQANVRKRLVKRPKVYLRDSGLLHSVLKVSDQDTLLAQPWVGASWEGFVIEQILNLMSAGSWVFEAYYFRTTDQHEIDLVIDLGRERWAMEVKLTASPSTSDMQKLEKTADMLGASRRFLVTMSKNVEGDDKRCSCDLPWLLQWIEAQAP